MAPDYRLWRAANTRHNSKHTPFSIPKLLTAVFAITASCSALVLDPISRNTNSLAQSGNRVDDRLIEGKEIPTSTTTSSHLHTSTTSATPSSAAASTTSSTASTTSSTAAAYTGLPQPFDVPLGSNFTSTTCPTIFTKIVADPNVRLCVPISLLIQGSRSFYHVEESPSSLNQTMQASCDVLSEPCNELFQSYAATVESSNGCKTELSEENSLVQQLYYGLISYLPIYQASCQRLSSTTVSTSTNENEYCLTDAIENGENPADVTLYTLPLGQPLSGAPTCSSCTKQAMSIFANAARNLTSPLADNYITAAKTINAACGTNFVDDSFTPIPGSDTTSGAESIVPRTPWMMALIAAGLLTLL